MSKILDAMQGYLRVCRCGGMTKKTSDQIESAVAEAERLGYFSDVKSEPNPNMEGVDEFISALISGTPTWPNDWGQDVAAAAFAIDRRKRK